jgi:hypothetical protein
MWRGLASLAVIFSPRPTGSYSQFLTDTVRYHH